LKFLAYAYRELWPAGKSLGKPQLL